MSDLIEAMVASADTEWLTQDELRQLMTAALAALEAK